MPSFQAAGDPAYQIFMTHTPQGTVVDNLNGMGRKNNLCCGYSGDVIFMYTHTGTHIDSLNHFGYGKEIYNKFNADEHLGSRHWMKNGCEQILPIVTRGVLLDIAAAKSVDCLPPSYGITPDDCTTAAKRQETPIREGDTVFVRTGRMRYWPDGSKVFGNSPGLTLDACRWLTSQKIVAVGADNEAVEVTPSGTKRIGCRVIAIFLLKLVCRRSSASISKSCHVTGFTSLRLSRRLSDCAAQRAHHCGRWLFR